MFRYYAVVMNHFIPAGQMIWIEQRLEVHNSGKGAKYTHGRGPVTLVYSETLSTKEEALHRECEIKKMTKTAKLALIKQNMKEYKQKY